MRKFSFLLFLSTILLFSNCVRVPDGGGGTGLDPEKNPWTKLDMFNSELPILNLYATRDFLMSVTGNEFTRFDSDQTILEKRDLSVNNVDSGTPAMSLNTFARLSNNSSAEQVLEFHLVKNAAEVVSFTENELKSNPNETIKIDFEGKEIGAFNPDGDLFLLPTKNFSNNHYTFFLFEIRLDPQTFHFQGVDIRHRIDLPAVITNPGTLSNIKWIGNQFFVATKNGGYRINKDGVAKKINNIWMKDFFQWSGEIYGTGFNDFDLIKSSDNGLSWQSATTSPIKLIRIQGGKLVSQVFRGTRYQIPVDHQDIFTVKEMLLNEDFPDNDFSYLAIENFSGKFYLALEKDIYFAPDIFAVE